MAVKAIRPANPLARKLRAKIRGIDRTIARREAEVRVLGNARDTYWRRWVSAQFGVHIGMRVYTERSQIYGSAPKRREYVVESIGNSLGSNGRPWLSGALVLKDGTVSKTVRHPLYEDWRFIDEKPRA